MHAGASDQENDRIRREEVTLGVPQRTYWFPSWSNGTGNVRAWKITWETGTEDRGYVKIFCGFCQSKIETPRIESAVLCCAISECFLCRRPKQ